MSFVKKFFFISLLIFIVSLLFLGIYRLSFYKPDEIASSAKKDAASSADASSDESNKETALKTKTAKISAVSNESILAPALSSDGLSVKYYTPNGHAYETDLDGAGKKTLSDKDLSDLENILWSPDKTKVISKFALSGGEIRFSFYDYTQKKGAALPQNIRKVIWDASGSKIFYAYYDSKSKKTTLNISDPDGTNWKKLADLSYQNISLSLVPKSGLVSFWNSPSNLTQTDLESIATLGGEKKVLFKEKFGADYLWSNSGNNVLVSHTDSKGGSKMQLATINYNGGEYANLGIPTFVSKCVWSKNDKILYYALPGNIPSSSMLPDDYDSGKIKTSDTFWKMDMTSKQSERIVALEDLQKINTAFDAADLFLSLDESFLFFRNKLDGKLYRISL